MSNIVLCGTYQKKKRIVILAMYVTQSDGTQKEGGAE